MVARAKNRKTFKQYLNGHWMDFKIISQKFSSYAPLPKLQKCFCSAEKMVARAKNRKTLKGHLHGQWPDFNFIIH